MVELDDTELELAWLEKKAKEQYQISIRLKQIEAELDKLPKQSTHGRDISIRPLDGGFHIKYDGVINKEKLVATFEEAVTEVFKWCFTDYKLGTECVVDYKIAEWAEGKA